jgi:N utilization substance protein A
MNKELVVGIKAVAAERALDTNVIFEAIEAALESTYRNRNGLLSNVVAKVDRVTGESSLFVEKEVTDEVLDDRTMITQEDANEVDPEAEEGDLVLIGIQPEDISRIAVQTAKQVIIQHIREAERNIIYQTYKDRVGEIISAQVRSVDSMSNTVTVTVNERSEFVLKREEQIPNDRLRRGDYIKLYVEKVEKDNRGPYVKLSRTHRNLLRRLLEQEIPELREGIVEIKNIVREPGARSKIAVIATVDNVDPVGSCVGMRGVRIKNIVSELAGERIDVVEWSEEPHIYILNAISPAKATGVVLHEDGVNRTATVVAADDQLSLAIGRSGQNARLTARLTGWRIDIKSETEAKGEGIDLLELQQNMIKHDQLAVASRRLARTQSESADTLQKAARILAGRDKASAEGDPKPDVLSNVLHDALGKPAASEAEEKWQSVAQEGVAPEEFVPPSPVDEAFREAAQQALKQMSYQEFTENLQQQSEAAAAEGQFGGEDNQNKEELPAIITADMLRARRAAAQESPQSLSDIEIPPELLAGYEAVPAPDEQATEEGGDESGKRRAPGAKARKRKDSPNAARFDELLDEK